MSYSFEAFIQNLVAEITLAGPILVGITALLGLVLAVRMRSGTLFSIRLFALVGLGLLGIALAFVASVATLACADTCPDDLPSALLGIGLLATAPSLLLCTLAWLLCLVLAARAQRWRRLLAVLLVLPLAGVIALLVLWIGTGGDLLPTTSDATGVWSAVFAFGVLPLLLCWPLAVLVGTIGMTSPAAPPIDFTQAAAQAAHALRLLPLITVLALGFAVVASYATVFGFDPGLAPPFVPYFYVGAGAAYLLVLTGVMGLVNAVTHHQWPWVGAFAALLLALLGSSPALGSLVGSDTGPLAIALTLREDTTGIVALSVWYLLAFLVPVAVWRSLRPPRPPMQSEAEVQPEARLPQLEPGEPQDQTSSNGENLEPPEEGIVEQLALEGLHRADDREDDLDQ